MVCESDKNETLVYGGLLEFKGKEIPFHVNGSEPVFKQKNYPKNIRLWDFINDLNNKVQWLELE